MYYGPLGRLIILTGEVDRCAWIRFWEACISFNVVIINDGRVESILVLETTFGYLIKGLANVLQD